MLKRTLVKSGQALVLLVAGCLLTWMLITTNRAAISLKLPWSVSLGIGSLLAIALMLGIIGLTHWLAHQKTSWLMLIFGGLTLIKLPLLWGLKIAPTSDFWNYHALAAYSAQGMTWKAMFQHGLLGSYVIFPHALNIANFFSIGTAFFGQTYLVSQLINIGCTGLDMLLLYQLISRWLSRRLGIAAALTFYAIPAYWLYSTLLNGAEPLFLTCFLLSMLGLTNALKPMKTATHNDQWLNLGLAWVATIAANMLRPIMTVWLIGLLIMSLWLLLQPLRHFRPTLRKLLIFIGASVLLFAGSSTIYSWMYGVNLAPSHVSTAYSLATGTDEKTSGQYDDQLMTQVTHDLKVMPTTNGAYAKIAANMFKVTDHNIHQLNRQGRWSAFINLKMQKLMAEDYGYNWVLYNLSHTMNQTKFGHAWYRFKPLLVSLSFGYFDLMLVGALVSVLLGLALLAGHYDYLNNYFFFSALLLDGFTLSAMLVEVQGRYHIILYLPLLFLMICGGAAIKRYRLKNIGENS
ncbi:hypothetical protein [Lactiplantibacillus songbeiensis]|uniref:Integral membrane protein n=1 Tax=Lactiplantibacillus songbeiensis TaxID=2559920 RepID=A0ABW4C2B1_9LACO|nr:hypothetical protein [Lactiplantibacillus songbeiensis]